MSTIIEPSETERAGWPEATRAYVEALEAAWPPLHTLVMPRNKAEAEPDPVLDALSFALRPDLLMPIWRELQDAGVDIPTRAEAEYAAALHFMVGCALRHGAAWRAHIINDLKAYAAARRELRQ